MATAAPSRARHDSAAMRERRRRILAEARRLLTEGGVEQLTLRRLAECADVAVGTIYGLIGGKEDVLIALFAELQSRLLARVEARGDDTPLEHVEAVAREVAALLREDEDYCRAAFLAIQHVDEAWPRREKAAAIFASAGELLADGFRRCREAGLLRGDVPAETLAALALQSYRMTWMEWACRHIGVTESLAESLRNVRIVLLADATDALRATLLPRLG